MKNKEDFNSKYYSDKIIIGVDFDDTITEHRPYPEIAPLDKRAKTYLDKLDKAGFELVLWSARVGEDYLDALRRCRFEFNMRYIKADSSIYPHGNSGKLVARFYIDDRSYFGKIPWKKIYKYLIKKYMKK